MQYTTQSFNQGRLTSDELQRALMKIDVAFKGKPPHPDAGKELQSRKIRRTSLGADVQAVRGKSGEVQHKAESAQKVEINFKRRGTSNVAKSKPDNRR